MIAVKWSCPSCGTIFWNFIKVDERLTAKCQCGRSGELDLLEFEKYRY